MDEARAAGLKVAVCSAATKSSVIATLDALIGKERFAALDVFMAGDDVPRKKPDPFIYQVRELRGSLPDVPATVAQMGRKDGVSLEG